MDEHNNWFIWVPFTLLPQQIFLQICAKTKIMKIMWKKEFFGNAKINPEMNIGDTFHVLDIFDILDIFIHFYLDTVLCFVLTLYDKKTVFQIWRVKGWH